MMVLVFIVNLLIIVFNVYLICLQKAKWVYMNVYVCVCVCKYVNMYGEG